MAPPPHLGAGPRDAGDLTAKVNTGLRRICGRRTVALGQKPFMIGGAAEGNAFRDFAYRQVGALREEAPLFFPAPSIIPCDLPAGALCDFLSSCLPPFSPLAVLSTAERAATEARRALLSPAPRHDRGPRHGQQRPQGPRGVQDAWVRQSAADARDPQVRGGVDTGPLSLWRLLPMLSSAAGSTTSSTTSSRTRRSSAWTSRSRCATSRGQSGRVPPQPSSSSPPCYAGGGLWQERPPHHGTRRRPVQRFVLPTGGRGRMSAGSSLVPSPRSLFHPSAVLRQ